MWSFANFLRILANFFRSILDYWNLMFLQINVNSVDLISAHSLLQGLMFLRKNVNSAPLSNHQMYLTLSNDMRSSFSKSQKFILFPFVASVSVADKLVHFHVLAK